MSFLSETLGIDPGTSYTRIYKSNQGVAINEPSQVAVDKYSGKILAVGMEADELIAKAPDSVGAVSPIRNGVIADFDMARNMFSMFLGKKIKSTISKPAALVAVPSGITDVSKRALEEALLWCGIKSVNFREKAMMSAMGANLQTDGVSGSMIVDIGSGTTEIAIMSMGGIIYSDSVNVGGDMFDASIINHIKKNHGVCIGHKMAEEIKIALCSFSENCQAEEYLAIGRDVSSGLPGSAAICSAEIADAIYNDIVEITDAICTAVEHTPSELASDVMNNGIMLTGGSSYLNGICEIIGEHTDIHAICCDDARMSVINGLGVCISGKNEAV